MGRPAGTGTGRSGCGPSDPGYLVGTSRPAGASGAGGEFGEGTTFDDNLNMPGEDILEEVRPPLRRIRPSLIARLFGRTGGFRSAEILPYGIRVRTTSGTDIIPFWRVREVVGRRTDFWGQIRLLGVESDLAILRGLRNRLMDADLQILQSAHSEFVRAVQFLYGHGGMVRRVAGWIDEGVRGERWIANHALIVAMEETAPLDLLGFSADQLTDDHILVGSVESIQQFRRAPQQFRVEANARFAPAELERFERFFDEAETEPLTHAQRLAVITHEDNTRVIAGAGSGKTAVMAVKAAYLLERELCRTNELLLVAFNKSAAEELRERTEAIVGLAVKATTFHALGLGIIGEVTGKRPSLAKSAEDPLLLKKEIRAIIESVVKHPEQGALVRTYFQSYFAPYRSSEEFKEIGDYYAYLKNLEIRSIRDERLRSFEEVEIANFLFLNGIEYEYERPYEVDLATSLHRQYQPDFFLPEYDIYIEHFGIGRDGSTAPHVPAEQYRAAMEWKRSIHREHGTELVETYSYLKREGTLIETLHLELEERGVEFRPISDEVLLKELNRSSLLDPFTSLIATFLDHFKGNGLDVAEVRRMAAERGAMDPRLDAFLAVFDPVFEQYQQGLKSRNKIDFNDMIAQSVSLVTEGAYRSPYRCVLVDEFQDISSGRARLVRALADQEASHRLFGVGDDWQAIYRFAGSDIALMRDFQEHFGFTETVYLDRTFRFNDRIEDVASGFVQRNPNQIPKTIVCGTKATEPRVVIHRPYEKTDDVFLEALEEIREEVGDEGCSVLVLGRYHFVLDGLAWSAARRSFPTLALVAKTVHSAKGTEADYVIVAGMTAGKYGFPSEIVDDPILDAVLSEPEGFPHAEERRLFYVALTRARYAVHILADHDRPSAFLSEIATNTHSVVARGAAAELPVLCPECITGELVRRTSVHGLFFGCSNYPLCKCTASTCRHCDQGAFVRRGSLYICSNSECENVELVCPECETGRLTERIGRYGPFLGCTNYSKGRCSFTMRIADGEARKHELIAEQGSGKWGDTDAAIEGAPAGAGGYERYG